MTAQVPETPAAPTTSINGSNVLIKWTAPFFGGSSITAYTVTIMKSDGATYVADAGNCDGSKASIVNAT